MRVMCKKDFKFERTYIKGKYYICGLTRSKIVTVCGENTSVSFSLYKDNNNYYHYFGDYFYSSQELRKLKINKLNKVVSNQLGV